MPHDGALRLVVDRRESAEFKGVEGKVVAFDHRPRRGIVQGPGSELKGVPLVKVRVRVRVLGLRLALGLGFDPVSGFYRDVNAFAVSAGVAACGRYSDHPWRVEKFAVFQPQVVILLPFERLAAGVSVLHAVV